MNCMNWACTNVDANSIFLIYKTMDFESGALNNAFTYCFICTYNQHTLHPLVVLIDFFGWLALGWPRGGLGWSGPLLLFDFTIWNYP